MSSLLGPYKTWSQYVRVRDGAQLAVYCFLPQGNADRQVPAVWVHDRYHQVQSIGSRRDYAAGRWSETSILPGDVLSDGLSEGGPHIGNFPWAVSLLKAGYAFIVVDSRGSGASTGVSRGPFAPVEAYDCYDVTEWIAEQMWCDGNIGMAGRSYLGISQLMGAATEPPHLRAIFPQMVMFDLFDFSADGGGIYRADFVESWGAEVQAGDSALDVNRLDDDPDGQILTKAQDDHKGNILTSDIFLNARRRDSISEVLQEPIYVTRNPASWITTLNKGQVPVRILSGWHDIWISDAFHWYDNLTNTRELIIGPWAHSTGLAGGDGFHLGDEHVRWFDRWLRPDSSDKHRPEAVIRYATIHRDEKPLWRETTTWPPRGIRQTRWNLSKKGIVPYVELGPAAVEIDYRLRLDCTTGTTSRWTSGYGGPFGYEDLAANDEKALTFTSAPLLQDVEMTGHPVVNLLLSAPSEHFHVFVYLEMVDAQGRSHYLTEGCIDPGSEVEVGHASRRGRPVFQGRPAVREEEEVDHRSLSISLHPISVQLQAGSRIRIAITGADRDNALPMEDNPPLSIRLHAGDADLPFLGNPRFAPIGSTVRLARNAPYQDTVTRSQHFVPAIPGLVCSAFHLEGPIDHGEIRRAINLLSDRYPVLRGLMASSESGPISIVFPTGSSLNDPLEMEISPAGWWKSPPVLAMVNAPWDLSSSPPFRCGIFNLGDGEGVGIVFVLHSAVADGPSARALLADVLASLNGSIDDTQPRIPVESRAEERSVDVEQALLSINGAMASTGIAGSELIGGPIRPTALCWRTVDDDDLADIKRFAAAQRTTLPSVLLLAWGLALRAWTGQEDVIVALVVNHRPEWDRTIGSWASVSAIRLNLPDGASGADLLRRIRTAIGQGMDRSWPSLNELATVLGHTFGDVAFNYCGATTQVACLPNGLMAKRVDLEVGSANLPICFTVHDSPDDFRLSVEFTSGISPFTANALLEATWEVLRTLGEGVDVGTVSTRDVALSRALLRQVTTGLPSAETLIGGCSAEIGVLLRGIRAHYEGGDSFMLAAPWWVEIAIDDELVPVGAVGWVYVADGSQRIPLGFGRWQARGTVAMTESLETPIQIRYQARGLVANEVETIPSQDTDVIERIVLDTWSELLGFSVDVGDDWFHLGGDSLQMVRLLSRIRMQVPDIRLGLADLFAASTVREQIELLNGKTNLGGL